MQIRRPASNETFELSFCSVELRCEDLQDPNLYNLTSLIKTVPNLAKNLQLHFQLHAATLQACTSLADFLLGIFEGRTDLRNSLTGTVYA